MSQVQEHQIREYDESGRLVRAGFWFVEPRTTLAGLFILASVTCGIAATISVFVAFSGSGTAAVVALVLAVACVLIWRHALTIHTVRTVIFDADGLTHYTAGVPLLGLKDAIAPLKHTLINSFEAGPCATNPEKLMIYALYSTGETLPLSFGQERQQDVRLMIRQLTEALAELRAANKPRAARGGLSADTEW